MDIQYRYPHGDREWDPNMTVTIEELWDGSTFDCQPLIVGTKEEYDYLRAMELMLGSELHELVLSHNFDNLIRWSVEIRIPLLDLTLAY